MTERLPATAAHAPLEKYADQFDDLFAQRSQREGFRRYLEGLLLPIDCASITREADSTSADKLIGTPYGDVNNIEIE